MNATSFLMAAFKRISSNPQLFDLNSIRGSNADANGSASTQLTWSLLKEVPFKLRRKLKCLIPYIISGVNQRSAHTQKRAGAQ